MPLGLILTIRNVEHGRTIPSPLETLSPASTSILRTFHIARSPIEDYNTADLLRHSCSTRGLVDPTQEPAVYRERAGQANAEHIVKPNKHCFGRKGGQGCEPDKMGVGSKWPDDPTNH